MHFQNIAVGELGDRFEQAGGIHGAQIHLVLINGGLPMILAHVGLVSGTPAGDAALGEHLVGVANYHLDILVGVHAVEVEGLLEVGCLSQEALAGDTVKALLVKIAERWSANEQMVISTSEAEQLKAYFAKNAKALLDKGVTIEQVNGKKAQFSIAPADGSYKVNFGEGEFEAFFKAFLRPQMVELLFS